jgi:hypothetical protein
MDGLPCEFYKAMWDTIGDDFSHLEIKVFNSNRLFKYLNQELIKLIPKNAAANTIMGWQPITLLGVAYKIMAIEVALRICLVAQKVV